MTGCMSCERYRIPTAIGMIELPKLSWPANAGHPAGFCMLETQCTRRRREHGGSYLLRVPACKFPKSVAASPGWPAFAGHDIEFGCATPKSKCVRWPVSRVLFLLAQEMAIPLGCASPHTSRDRPGRRSERQITCRPYLVLLPVGLAMPSALPPTRCALTAPFQPCSPTPLAGLRRSKPLRACRAIAA